MYRLLALCLVVATLLAPCFLDASTSRPNVIVILADDMGFSDLSCYGSEITTPNIDSLAADGLRYSRFYNCARCCPSRAALLTGLYPHQSGVGDMVDQYAAGTREKLGSPAYSDHLDIHAPTMAEVLGLVGYQTSMAGKWHLGYRPAEWPVARGFARSFAQIEGAMNYYGYGPQHSLPQGERGCLPMAMDDQPFTPPQKGFFTTEAYTDFAVRTIREQQGNARPFFMYLAYNAPHWPLQAHPETIARHRHAYDAGWDKVRAARYERLKASGMINTNDALAPRPPRLAAWENLAPKKQETWKEWMAVYAAQVEELDNGIGQVLKALRETGLETNTLVFFMSDNGGAAERPVRTIEGASLGSQDSFEGYDLEGAHVSCTPLRRTKSFVHEGGISGPLIVRWPAGIAASQAGGLVKEPVHIIDMMTTVVGLTEAKIPKQWHDADARPLEGISLAPSFAGKKLERKAPLFWEHEGNHAVLDGKWKLVAERNDPWELYDMESDRTENHNVADAHPDIVELLTAKYDQWTKRAGVLPWPQASQAAKRPAGAKQDKL